MKISAIRGLAVAVIAVAAAGCSGSSTPPAPASTVAAQPATTMAPAGSSATAFDFGVPACDQYMRKYAACVDTKVPEAARATMKQQMEMTHMSWKQAASTPEGRTALTSACTQAEATAKQAMASYGCTW